ncbi:MAG TPA: Sec-independent protein translocase subunit TatA [Mycobacteriales bacterium]|jgi:sec-independent protein translocase protein TatA|nr:Sec-independent protein translocase subunit TatA [Mycobacteriales bacterium]
MGDLSPWHLLIIAIVLVLLFGSRKLPGAAKSIGQSLKIFKDETKGLRGDDHEPPAMVAPPVIPPVAAAPPVVAQPVVAAPAPAAPVTPDLPGAAQPAAMPTQPAAMPTQPQSPPRG